MFSANPRTAMNAYRGVGVESIVDSASPHRLVLMLFDGASAAVASAIANLRNGNVPAKCQAISKAMAIIDGALNASLDLNVGGELAKGLSDLYDYMTRRLLQANLANDLAALEEVSRLLEELGSAWAILAAAPVAPVTRSPAPQPPLRATTLSYGAA